MLKKMSLISVLAAVVSFSVQAAPFFSHNSRRTPGTLIVVGNYKTPRLMAATIKGLTSQPYLIITKDNRYFAVLTKATVPVPADKLDVYINQLNPKRVVIIGDERFVTRAQENKLRTINIKRIPIIRIYGGDWGRIAEELDDLLNIGNLAREFRRNYFDLSMSDTTLRAADPQGENQLPAVPADNNNDVSEELPSSEPEEL